ncbi:MAG: hypothetical protein HKL82_12550 [Acidimicrobiaceae bacterium]|nr:hypothetical protein [Acidimicrobiaceae bacterium]
MTKDGLRPDVFFGNGAIEPFGNGHHAGAVLEFSDQAGPISRAELDRMRGDLRWRTAPGLFDVRLQGGSLFKRERLSFGGALTIVNASYSTGVR